MNLNPTQRDLLCRLATANAPLTCKDLAIHSRVANALESAGLVSLRWEGIAPGFHRSVRRLYLTDAGRREAVRTIVAGLWRAS